MDTRALAMLFLSIALCACERTESKQARGPVTPQVDTTDIMIATMPVTREVCPPVEAPPPKSSDSNRTMTADVRQGVADGDKVSRVVRLARHHETRTENP